MYTYVCICIHITFILTSCAFGRLKGRRGFPTRIIDLILENVPKVVLAWFVLHNYCELN